MTNDSIANANENSWLRVAGEVWVAGGRVARCGPQSFLLFIEKYFSTILLFLFSKIHKNTLACHIKKEQQ